MHGGRGCAAARLVVVGYVVHLGCYFEDGAVEVAVVVVVDQEEVWWAVPIGCILLEREKLECGFEVELTCAVSCHFT